MKKLLTILTAMTFVLSGCGSTEKAGIGMVTDTGGINDKSFNQGTWEGIEAFKKDNPEIEANYIESKDGSQFEQNLNVSAQKHEVVVASGYVFAEPMYKTAQANPDTDFVLIDTEPLDANGEVAKLDNVHSYVFKEEEAGYLVGYIAGKETKTNHVGFIGGVATPPVQRFGIGYLAGVNDANPKATVDFNYTGSFEDVALGKTTASAMYKQGADVIFSAAGGLNTGVVEAAKEIASSGDTAWVIGVDRDMYEDGKYTDKDGNEKSVILTSAVKRVGEAANEGLEAHFDGEFKGGVDNLGYEEDGISLPEKNPNLDQAIIDQATEALEENENIPKNKEQADKYLSIKVNGKY